MNTLQLDRALKRNTFTKKTFVGVFAADELPKLNTFPCGFVANTDPSTEPGTLGWHFISPHVKKENFSIVTATPLNITDLNPTKSKHGTNINCKVRGVTCVDNTVFFTFIIKVVVNLFTDKTTLNDCNVACYVKNHFNVVIENQPVCGLNQCCKPLFK